MENNKIMSKEDIEQAIDSGNSEVIADYLSGGISIGEQPVDDTPPVEMDVPAEVDTPAPVMEELNEEYASKTKEELLAEFTDEQPKLPPQNPDVTETLRAELKQQIADQAKKSEDEIATLKKELANKNNTVTEINLDGESDDDREYASVVSKNNRKLIEELKSTIGSETSNEQVNALIGKIEQLELAEKKRQETYTIERASNAQKESLTKMFTEVSGLQDMNEHFKTNVGIKDLYDEYNGFKTRIGDYVGSKDSTVVNKAVYAAIEGTTQRDLAFQNKLREVGIDIPEEGKTYVKLAEIVDLKNGVKYDRTTGNYSEIRDEYGKRVNQQSIEDAYKLSNYYNIMSDAEKTASKKIQQKLDSFEQSATMLHNDDLANPEEVNQVSMLEAQTLLDMPASAINRNPELKKKFDLVMQQLTK